MSNESSITAITLKRYIQTRLIWLTDFNISNMITERSVGYQLLDSNIEALRELIERILTKSKGPHWKTAFAKRKGKYYPQFVETENIDYNLIPVLVSDYPNSFNDRIAIRGDDDLLFLFSYVRDCRNTIAHHAEFNEKSLIQLIATLRQAFEILGIGSHYHEVTLGSYQNDNLTEDIVKNTKTNVSSRKSPSLLIDENSVESEYLESKNWIYLNNFIISEGKKGLGQTICVEFQRGANKGKRFLYSHDLIYDLSIEHLETLDSWRKYRFNTSSTSIRKDVRDYVKELKNEDDKNQYELRS